MDRRMWSHASPMAAALLLLPLTSTPALASYLTFDSSPVEGTAAADIDFVSGEGLNGDSISAGCTACVAVTSPPQLAVGTYGFTLSATGGSAGPVSAVPGVPGLDVEAYDISGTLAVSGAANPVSATLTGASIFAEPGSSSATLELNLGTASSEGQTLPVNLYLWFSGVTSAPVTLNSDSSFDSMTLDWTGTLSSTPYAPLVPVPVPGSFALLLSGLLLAWALGAWARRSAAARPRMRTVGAGGSWGFLQYISHTVCVH